MTSPSREHLLGFLLGALERHEYEQVQAELDQNPALRAELARLEGCIDRLGLSETPHQFDPPVGLAVRTCRYVELESAEREVQPSLRPTLASAVAETSRRFSWSDLTVAAAVLVAAASLLFPALSYSQFHSQVATCQNNLRLLGVALHDYSTQQADERFPGPEATGNRASAGVYAPTLVSHQLVSGPRVFLCPSSPMDRDLDRFVVPTLDELDRATGPRLAAMQRTMGGDYGYNMGYTQDGKLMQPCNSRRAKYVLLADAPSNLQPGRVSANHRGRGQNILYEDGHVQFIVEVPSPHLPDDPFHNREGWIAAGLDADDVVLGASGDHPMPVSPDNN